MRVTSPKLPKPVDKYPASIGILGEPISKLEFRNRQSLKRTFLISISQHIRHLVEAIARLEPGDIQVKLVEAFGHQYPAHKRARSAWEVLAWHHFLKPYAHPERSYRFQPELLIPIIEKDPDSLFLYAMILVKEPSDDIYAKLKTMNQSIAKQYRDYCRNYAIVQHDEDISHLLFGW